MMNSGCYDSFEKFRKEFGWMCRQYNAQKSVLERYRGINDLDYADCADFSELSWEELDAYWRCRYCRTTVETVDEVMEALAETAGRDAQLMIYAHLVDHEVVENLELEYHMTRRQLGYLEKKSLEGIYRNEIYGKRQGICGTGEETVQENRTDFQGG